MTKVFDLNGHQDVRKDGEGIQNRDKILAQDWYGPDPDYDPFDEGEPSFKIIGPDGTFYVRETDLDRDEVMA